MELRSIINIKRKSAQLKNLVKLTWRYSFLIDSIVSGLFPLISQITEKLVAAGANLDEQDWEGQTALHWAAREGSVSTVLHLIDSGADTSVEDARGYRFCYWVS